MKKLVLFSLLAVLGLVGCAHTSSNANDTDQALQDLKQPTDAAAPAENPDPSAVTNGDTAASVTDTSSALTTADAATQGPDLTPPAAQPADVAPVSHPRHRRHKHKRHAHRRHHKKSRHHAKRRHHHKHRPA